jgi:hypothetical protein
MLRPCVVLRVKEVNSTVISAGELWIFFNTTVALMAMGV